MEGPAVQPQRRPLVAGVGLPAPPRGTDRIARVPPQPGQSPLDAMSLVCRWALDHGALTRVVPR